MEHKNSPHVAGCFYVVAFHKVLVFAIDVYPFIIDCGVGPIPLSAGGSVCTDKAEQTTRVICIGRSAHDHLDLSRRAKSHYRSAAPTASTHTASTATTGGYPTTASRGP